ncbi:hypothetical protein KDW63_01235 [Burkholderia cenocepacia]|uniref:hypothetical protein n=1 Tax=Burkholderia cenocepacia TaxID=95486 RepID=UPI001B950E6F|nr:hypothetical protein [Burkholderia cenocepacia]MBR8292792.1 hypothetical protein [Burkholderia cenocepacia]MBR8374645.1 hypothetical protein [Burkholderia cenocepacia]
MKISRTVPIVVVNFAMAIAAHAEGLCTVEETVVFNCELEKSISSLCQTKGSGVLVYRNGNDGKINLEIYGGNGVGRDVFYFSNTSYAGGGEAHIRFSRFGYAYYLYDRTIKTEGGPTFSAGIVVYKGRKRISNLMCNNDASIREEAYREIAREKYRPIDVDREN